MKRFQKMYIKKQNTQKGNDIKLNAEKRIFSAYYLPVRKTKLVPFLTPPSYYEQYVGDEPKTLEEFNSLYNYLYNNYEEAQFNLKRSKWGYIRLKNNMKVFDSMQELEINYDPLTDEIFEDEGASYDLLFVYYLFAQNTKYGEYFNNPTPAFSFYDMKEAVESLDLYTIVGDEGYASTGHDLLTYTGQKTKGKTDITEDFRISSEKNLYQMQQIGTKDGSPSNNYRIGGFGPWVTLWRTQSSITSPTFVVTIGENARDIPSNDRLKAAPIGFQDDVIYSPETTNKRIRMRGMMFAIPKNRIKNDKKIGVI